MSKARRTAEQAAQPDAGSERDMVERSPRWASALLGGFVLIVAGIGVYANSLSGAFILDDIHAILLNPNIRQLSPLSTAMSAPAQLPVAGRPVACLSLALNYALGEFAVRGYHVFNLAVHVLCALLLFGIVRRTLRSPLVGERFARSGDWLALIIALLWTVHPLQTESVTYVVQRTELLMGMFYLLMLYCCIRGWAARRGWPWFVFAIAACALGMGSKEVMVSAPLMVLLYERAFVTGSFGVALRRRWPVYLGLAATWIILAALIIGGPRDESVGFGLKEFTALEYLKTQAGVLLWYLRLVIWPEPLIIHYAWPKAQTLTEYGPHGIVVLALLAVTVWGVWRRPWLGFLGAWFFTILAPTSSFVPIVTEVAAERRMYLPLAAVITVLVIAAGAVLDLVFRGTATARARGRFVAGAALTIVVAALLGFGTVERNKDYRSQVALWADVIANRPDNAIAHTGLGTALLAEGQIPPAIEHFRLALEIIPDFVDAHSNLAIALDQQGNTTEALHHFRQAVRCRPDRADAHLNLAIALQQARQPDEAIAEYRTGHKLGGGDADTHCNLADLLLWTRRVDEAVQEYRAALNLDPNHARALQGFRAAGRSGR
ncbi:MAG: tetratricopeptide repeat protein [Planctomycetes bacterium]|nr:tetratricopeptide repeat protein [Planctomycetota bacterium]